MYFRKRLHVYTHHDSQNGTNAQFQKPGFKSQNFTDFPVNYLLRYGESIVVRINEMPFSPLKTFRLRACTIMLIKRDFVMCITHPDRKVTASF